MKFVQIELVAIEGVVRLYALDQTGNVWMNLNPIDSKSWILLVRSIDLDPDPGEANGR